MCSNVFRKKPIQYERGGNFISGVCIFFQFYFIWYYFMNQKHEALWLLKKSKLHTLCTLILSNPLHLPIGSRLTLTLNELLVSKCYHINFKAFCLCLA
jgi:hypothetical protein